MEMQEPEMRRWIYDIEVFKKDWIVVFKEVGSDRYSVFHNDNEILHDFIDARDEDILFGFNNKHYDDYVLKAMYHGADPDTVKDLNDWIIVKGGQGWEHPFLQYKKKVFQTSDLRDDVVDMGLSLKAIEGNLGLNIVESSVDFTIDRKLTEEEIEEVIFYCKKDVDATEKLYQQRIEYINAKEMIGEMYGVDVREALGMTNAKLCARIMNAEPKEFNDERDYRIPDQIDQSKIPEPIMKFFSQIWDESIPDEELWSTSLEFVFKTQAGECPCTYAWGGAHGAKPCYVAEATEDLLIENYDVGSLYPNSALNFGFTSRTTEDPDAYRNLVDTRLSYKHGGNKPKSNALKLPINTYYGAMLNKYNALYDPKMGRSICITNQLAMTVLVVTLAEECESFDLINYNTDGIMYHISKAEQEKAHQIVAEWEKVTGFEMELDPPIKKIIQKDVNNYIELREDGSYKCKGGYVNIVDGGSFKMNSLRIVQQAIVEHFIHGKKVEETVNNATDPQDFQMIAKTGSTYKACVHMVDGEEVEVNKVNRVYASKDESLGTLYKVKYTKGVKRKDKVANLPDHCVVDNENQISLDQIDRSFYIKMAKSRIRDFTVIKKAVVKSIEKMEVIEIMATGTTKKSAETAVDTQKMNIFQKLNAVRAEFAKAPINKSGKNTFAKFNYFELEDIIPVAQPLLEKYGLCYHISFDTEKATGYLVDVDTVKDDISVTKIHFSSPMIELDVRAKGMNSMQALGACQTYQRRYLWMLMLELVENDTLDASSGNPKNEKVEKPVKEEKESAPKKPDTPAPDDSFMNIPEDSPEEIPFEAPTEKTVKAIKKALKELRDNGGDEKYIKDCLFAMKNHNFLEYDAQRLLVEITEKL